MTRIFAGALIAITLAWGGVASAEASGATCAARPTILSLAQKIIDGRDGLSRLKRGRFGTDAAYLLIRYGDLDRDAALAVLDGVRRADELRGAYEIAHGLRSPAEIETLDDFRKLDWSGWRALLLADDSTRVFELLRLHFDNDEADLPGKNEDKVAYFALKLMEGASDAERARIAATAERAEEVAAALTLLADQRDLTAFREMAARYPEHRMLREMQSFPENLGASVRLQSAPIDMGRDETAVREEWRARGFELRRADYHLGSFAFLRILLNTIGEEYFISDAAAGFNDLIDDGGLDPVKRPEQAVISLYRQLVERMGQAAVDEGLSGFRIPIGTRRGGRVARDMIHGFIASEALRGTVRGAETVPRIPILLAETDFDWQAWVQIAVALRDGGAGVVAGFEKSEAGIAADLALAAGQPELAEAAIEAGMAGTARLSAFKALMIRLDQRCAAYRWMPGTAFGSIPIYRF